MISSSSSLARLRLLVLLGPLFAADMLGRRGELENVNCCEENSHKAVAEVEELTYLMLCQCRDLQKGGQSLSLLGGELKQLKGRSST